MPPDSLPPPCFVKKQRGSPHRDPWGFFFFERTYQSQTAQECRARRAR